MKTPEKRYKKCGESTVKILEKRCEIARKMCCKKSGRGTARKPEKNNAKNPKKNTLKHLLKNIHKKYPKNSRKITKKYQKSKRPVTWAGLFDFDLPTKKCFSAEKVTFSAAMFKNLLCFLGLIG